jgi:DNA-binding CsgD family transcriptional regulator
MAAESLVCTIAAADEGGIMKHVAAITHFRQLCCLGVEAQTLMPAALKALHDLIGSDGNAFFWTADSGEIGNVYFEQPMPRDIAALYFNEFLNNPRRPDSTVQIRKLLRPGEVVGNSTRLFPPRFYRSDMYNLIWRPLHRESVMWARVPNAQGRNHGVALHRGVGDSHFGERDEKMLIQLIPYFAHALNGAKDAREQLAPSGETGLIICDEYGQVRYESPEGYRLMLLAAHPRIGAGVVDWKADTIIPAALRQLCRQLSGIFLGRPAPPPVLQQRTPWGTFTFRAHWLEEPDRSGSALIGVTVERHVPLRLRLLDAMRTLPLSPKQKEVCLKLAEGASYKMISEHLHISHSTVVDHVRKIYDKLDAHSHQELVRKLMQEPAPSSKRSGPRPLGSPGYSNLAHCE